MEVSDSKDAGIWFLKVDENQIRGPVPFATLREWAESGSLKAEEEISRDGQNWQPAASLPALELGWTADIGGGRRYGPFNLLAAPQLVAQGILKADSVLRRQVPTEQPHLMGKTPTGAVRPRSIPPVHIPGSRAMISDGTRIGSLERELKALHAELATLHLQRQEATSGASGARALTATRPNALTERIDQIYDKAHRTEAILQQLVQNDAAVRDGAIRASAEEQATDSGAPVSQVSPENRIATFPMRRRPMPILYVDESDIRAEQEMSHPERVRELARTRRFRVQTLRWNVINSSLVVGTGSTVGAIGLILEVHPVTWTGLILAAIGCVHFLFTMLIWMGSKMINWAHISVVSDTEALAGGRPVRGMLNVTFFWFKRRFGASPDA